MKWVNLLSNYRKRKLNTDTNLITKNEMIREFCRRAENEQAAFFIGAGISVPYGLPDFEGLVRKNMKGIIDYEGEIYDCPEMMQYILNKSGDRESFYADIKSNFNLKYDEINRSTNTEIGYLKSIVQSTISTIWTTNFDDLIEQALKRQDIEFSVKNCEKSFRDNFEEKNVIEVLKIHGDINSENIVLTKADYDDFDVNNKLAIKRLENDMLSKSIMFIGYSYNDPNIKNIVNSIRQILKDDTKKINHYLLMKEKKNKDEIVLQQLWIEDLKRYGIKTYLLNDYEELKEILSIIKLKSRGNRIFITGSHNKEESDIANELGVKLANLNIKVNYGQSEGIGKIVCSAYAKELVKNKKTLADRLFVYTNPYAFCNDWDDDDKILEFLKELRKDMIRNTQVLIAFPGGKGTLTEIDLAVREGCIVIPIFMKNSDFISKVTEKWPDIIDKLAEIDANFVDKLMNNKCYVEDIINFLKGIFGDV